jgi:hypothetical protein
MNGSGSQRGSQRFNFWHVRERDVARRRGHGENSIYLDTAGGRYVGAVSLGHGPNGRRIRRKVTGKTKQEVRDKLKALHAEFDSGLRTSAGYTVRAGRR